MCLMPGPQAEMRPDKTGVHKMHQNRIGLLLSRVEEEARLQTEEREGTRGAPGYVLSMKPAVRCWTGLTETLITAQVEVLLKDAPKKASFSEATPQNVSPPEASSAPGLGPQQSSIPDAADEPFSWNYGSGVPGPASTEVPGFNTQGPQPPVYPEFSMAGIKYRPRAEDAGASRNELLGLGLFEALPPTEMIEDLHRTFFTRQHPLNPIIHPGRYMQAYHSGGHLRPPMALIYAVWTMATNGHDKYSSYHDAFHRRTRHYLEEDELRGEGEHFITVAHAQAWALLATDEARCMWFTRAAMSTARCIKLIHMMGLHRLDDPNAAAELAPTIAPPRDWAELEERRRVFWGAYCVDSHASISTGWPSLVDMSEVGSANTRSTAM